MLKRKSVDCMNGTIDNSAFRRMLKSQSAMDRIAYLEFMINFYFKVMLALKEVGFKSPFRAQMSTSVQMMFTKGKAMRELVEGFSHKAGPITLNSQADHTILFTIVRAAYEQLCAFELIYKIPDSEDKRTIMENVYVAAAQVNRLKMFTEEGLARNPENVAIVVQDIEDCRREIQGTVLYQSLSEKEKADLEKIVFKKGDYQIAFTADGRLIPHIGWDDVRKYCRLQTDALHGVYKFACSMAHPSYLGLIQFHDAYKEGAIGDLNDTAVMQMIAIMSVYIMDFMEEFPEAMRVYSEMNEESQFMVRMYSECFRNSSGQTKRN